MKAFNVLSFLVAATAALYAVWISHRATDLPSPLPPMNSSIKPRYYIPNQKREHLIHVREAFERAGYELVTNDNLTDDWHTMWTFHNPFWQREPTVDLPEKMTELLPHQKVNHLPGASRFTSKLELARHSRALSFIPKSFLIPEEHDQFAAYRLEHPTAAWVLKGARHRGVKMIDPSILPTASLNESIAQEFIRPYLVDNRLWDVGLYIAITSVEPLRMYYFDNILIRACQREFEADLSKASRDSYVVADDYVPPWGLPSFRPYYSWGMSTLNVLRAFFHREGKMEFDEIFVQMQAAALELVGRHTEWLQRSARKYPHGQQSFYSIYRIDFIIDQNMKPWITEVNQSPNLSSAHFYDLSIMFRRICNSLLSLVGLGRGGLIHPDSTDTDRDVLLHTNDVDIGYALCHDCNQNCSLSKECILCRPCRTSRQTALLKELISEHRSRLGFIPLYPLRNRTVEIFRHLMLPGEDHALQQAFVIEKCRQDYAWC